MGDGGTGTVVWQAVFTPEGDLCWITPPPVGPQPAPAAGESWLRLFAEAARVSAADALVEALDTVPPAPVEFAAPAADGASCRWFLTPHPTRPEILLSVTPVAAAPRLPSSTLRLTELHRTTLELSQCRDLDELCRRSVALARERLGYDRAGLWLADPTPGWARGSYGVDEQGQVRDERSSRVQLLPGSVMEQVMGQRVPVEIVHDTPLYDDQAHRVGHGTQIVAGLSDGDRVIGCIATDNLLHSNALGEDDAQTLALYATAIGHLYRLKQAEQALISGERRYRHLVEQSPDPVFVVRRGEVLYANQAAAQMLGVQSPAELLGKPDPRWLSPLELERVQARLAVDEPTAETITFDVRLQSRSLVTLELEAVAIPCSYDGRDAWQIVARDVTQQRLEQAALLRASRLEATATLAGGIAHEFNNLMVTVLGNAELVSTSPQTPPEAAGRLHDIARAARRAGELAHQLLAYAQGGRYQPRQLDLSEVTAEAVGLHHGSIPADVTIITSLAEELLLVEADRSQLSQVVVTLCLNALEAVGAHGSIELATRRYELAEPRRHGVGWLPPGHYARLTVRDDGPGMPAEIAERVFEPFFTTKFQGRGLGLAAAYGIVSNHGGAITLETTPGAGSTFAVYLPICPQHQTGQRPVAAQPQVLVVDDDAMSRRLTQRVVERTGWSCVASGGTQALAKLAEHPNTVAAMIETQLSQVDPCELLAKLRSMRPGLLTIGYGPYGEDRVLRDLLKNPGTIGLVKPLRPGDLAAVLASLAPPDDHQPEPLRKSDAPEEGS